MRWVWIGMIAFGAFLIGWAEVTLPKDVSRLPKPIIRRVSRGPYRFSHHPMYLGNTLFITGLGGLSGGIFSALAFFTISELLFRSWIGTEEGK